jgi:predicted nucleotidyltransferase
MTPDIEHIKQKATPVLKRYGVRKASLFGSCVRGEMNSTSDIDMLVEIERDISLLEFVELKLQLESILGRSVDLVEYDTIKPLLKEYILKEQVALV